MNFKKIALVAGLAFAAASSFAVDIDLSTAASTPKIVDDYLAMGDAALTLGDVNEANVALIMQEGVDGSAGDVIAMIDQNLTIGGFAMIYQGPEAAPNGSAIAYIQQSGTTNARAVILQR